MDQPKKSADWVARVLALLSLAVTSASAVFTYRNSEASRRQAELKEREFEREYKTDVAIAPYPDDDGSMCFKVINMGAPVVITGFGFKLDEPIDRPEGSSYPEWVQPFNSLVFHDLEKNAGLPRRLERNEGLDFRVTTSDVAGSKIAAKSRVTAVFVSTSAGEVFDYDHPMVTEFFRTHAR
jgi:hypothetical protein